jgi:hypothetical protein
MTAFFRRKQRSAKEVASTQKFSAFRSDEAKKQRLLLTVYLAFGQTF